MKARDVHRPSKRRRDAVNHEMICVSKRFKTVYVESTAVVYRQEGHPFVSAQKQDGAYISSTVDAICGQAHTAMSISTSPTVVDGRKLWKQAPENGNPYCHHAHCTLETLAQSVVATAALNSFRATTQQYMNR